MRGVGGVRKRIDQRWLAKGLGLGLLCWGFKGVQENSVGRGQHSSNRVSGIFQQDNAPVHNSILITEYLIKMGIKTVPHHPYSPDLAPSNFCLFTKLRGCRYETIEEMKEAVTKVIDTPHRRGLRRGLAEVFGTVQVHCSRRRLLRRGLEFHVCTIKKSAHTKKAWKLIVCSSYQFFL